jgi:Tfp pilus assembly protein PilX
MKPHFSAFSVSAVALRRTQGGAVLLIALIAMIAMTLAALALVRTVDTGTLVASNLSFKQDASHSGDIAVEQALTWLDTTYTASASLNPMTDASHPFNHSNPSTGYYSHMTLDPLSPATWSGSALAGTYGGNTISYIIQRMCRLVDTPSGSAECLSSDADSDNYSHKVCHYNDDCGQVVPSGTSPIYRITVRIQGAKNTLSYLQALVF